MTNMGSEFSKLSNMITSSNAYNLIGKQVDVVRGDEVISGTVEAVMGKDVPQVYVNGKYYDLNDIEKVSIKEAQL